MEFQMPSCGGCRTCEIACSFHHQGEFIPSLSSLRIVEHPEEYGYSVELLEKSTGQRPACDGCEDLDVPLCISYCCMSDDLEEILGKFLNRNNLNRGHSGKGPRHGSS